MNDSSLCYFCLSNASLIHTHSYGLLPHTNTNRYVRNIFSSTYQTTVSVDFALKRVTVKGVDFNVQLWDIAGQETFRGLSRVSSHKHICGNKTMACFSYCLLYAACCMLYVVIVVLLYMCVLCILIITYKLIQS
jgi:hypothetical protein